MSTITRLAVPVMLTTLLAAAAAKVRPGDPFRARKTCIAGSPTAA